MPSLVEFIDKLRNDRATLERVVNVARTELRSATASDARDLKKLIAEGEERLGEFDERIAELVETSVREAAAAEHHVTTGTTGLLEYTSGPSGWSVGAEPGIYRDPHQDSSSPSFFKDLRDARMGDFNAAERLTRNHRSVMETRAGDMSTVAGSGGQFAPPGWLVDEFVALARPGQVTANLCQQEALPSGISSVNLPKVASGATTGVQATQNSALSDTAMTTTSVSSGITTIGGKQIVSLQLLNQSGIPFDRVILADLAADYSKTLDQQVLYGTNASGQLRGLVGVAVNTPFTTASPALMSVTSANSFFNRVVGAAAGIATTRFLPADALVLSPNRWAWCLEALDGNSRPQITADGPTVNSVAISTESVAEGSVGTLGKIPVYLDPNISLTANSATNQDEAYILRSKDVYLWTSALLLEAFDSTYADQASVLFRCIAWSAFIPDRYTGSVASIRGTGLVAPTL